MTVGGDYPYCAPGCRLAWVGDGVCDDACFCEECGWDTAPSGAAFVIEDQYAGSKNIWAQHEVVGDCSKAVRLERYQYGPASGAPQPEGSASTSQPLAPGANGQPGAATFGSP